MTSMATTAPAPLARHQVGRLFGQTMGLVALTAAVFALGAYIGRDISEIWAICAFVLSFVVLLGMNAAVQRSEQLALGLLFAFGLLLGLAVAPTLAHYVGADPRSVWLAGGATALFVAGFGAAGYATRRDLSALARVLFWALVALIVFGIALVFVEIRAPTRSRSRLPSGQSSEPLPLRCTNATTVVPRSSLRHRSSPARRDGLVLRSARYRDGS